MKIVTQRYGSRCQTKLRCSNFQKPGRLDILKHRDAYTDAIYIYIYTIYYEVSRTTREHDGHCATAARRGGSSDARKCLSAEKRE